MSKTTKRVVPISNQRFNQGYMVKILDLQKNWDKFDIDILVNELEKPIVKMVDGEGHKTL